MLPVVLILFACTVVSAQNTSTNNTVAVVPPEIHQCFYEGRWYPVGTLIAVGRSFDWCFRSYCDVDGIVKHWDDFNCGTKPRPDTSKPVTTPAPVTAPPLTYPTTSSIFGFGCWYRGRFFWSGEDIENSRRGFHCFGKYCDWNGRIQSWSDDCRHTIPPPMSSSVDLS